MERGVSCERMCERRHGTVLEDETMRSSDTVSCERARSGHSSPPRSVIITRKLRLAKLVISVRGAEKATEASAIGSRKKAVWFVATFSLNSMRRCGPRERLITKRLLVSRRDTQRHWWLLIVSRCGKISTRTRRHGLRLSEISWLNDEKL